MLRIIKNYYYHHQSKPQVTVPTSFSKLSHAAPLSVSWITYHRDCTPSLITSYPYVSKHQASHRVIN